MKKCSVLVLALFLLTGCGAEETYETLGDEMLQPVMAQPMEIQVQLPDETILPAMESETGVLYICKDYDVTVQTLPGGDLKQTIREISGYDPEDLTVLETMAGDMTQYDFVWTSSSDGGEMVNRGCILDDGNYHYILCAATDAELAEEYREIWNGMFETFGVSYPEIE